MKNFIKFSFFALMISFFVMSCNENRDNGEEITSVDRVKIDSVKIAQDTMDIYTIQTIKTYSSYPDGCHGFYGYDYVPDAMNRYVISYQYTRTGVCTFATYVGTNSFNFRPEQKGTYTFKFWNGLNSSNQNVWIEKKVVVQ